MSTCLSAFVDQRTGYGHSLLLAARQLSYSGGYIEPYRSRLEELRDMIIAGDIEVPCIPASRTVLAAELGLTGCDADVSG